LNISEAMAAIAEEAERQGFHVSQVRSGMWKFSMGGDSWFVHPRTPDDLLDILSILIAAGLNWAAWHNPHGYERD